jgi:thiol-disulfide isomerase/thioredoxin
MKRAFGLLVLPFVLAWFSASAWAAPAPISVGQPAPQLTYHLLDGKTLAPAQLRGRKYILWTMGTWCPSCVAGSQMLAKHIAELQRAHVALVEMEAYDNLGGNGPSLASVKAGIGAAAQASNWYWGILTERQTALIDPKSAMDVFYLVDASGKVVAQGMAPGAHWDRIEAFVNGRS